MGVGGSLSYEAQVQYTGSDLRSISDSRWETPPSDRE